LAEGLKASLDACGEASESEPIFPAEDVAITKETEASKTLLSETSPTYSTSAIATTKTSSTTSTKRKELDNNGYMDLLDVEWEPFETLKV
jgi:hypothetical protein